MELIRAQAYARAGLIGNPSDGYHGRTLSLIVRNYCAEVVLYEWEDMEIILSQEDRCRFGSMTELQQDVQLHGYYGGVRLVKATIRRFADYCQRNNLLLHDRNFSIRYQSNIPRAVGMAGSSGIIIATLRALMRFYHVEIPLEVQPSLALSVETGELRINGGLQDRVVQVYEGLVYMNFAEECTRILDGMEAGQYETLDPGLLPNLYMAFSHDAGEPTEVTHAPLRARYDDGDPKIHTAMKRFAAITDEARDALLAADHVKFHQLVDENFDLRQSICDLSPSHVRMIQAARSSGASAKFAGSGGAIVGTFTDQAQYKALTQNLKAIGCEVFRPQIEA
ncbi:MAG: GHMP kinase [Rhodopirellula sp.]|nr:GHMP kinase [Rhodopirellula sp.]